MKSIKFLFVAILSSITIFTGCKESSDVDDPGNQPNEEPQISFVDLSEAELANCYIVQTSGYYKFRADNQFNLGEGLPVPPQISPVSADLIWQSDKGSIKDVNLIVEDDKAFVTFEVTKAEGNALIAVFNDNNEIQWSWHIWMPLEEITSLHTDTGYDVMNMNLGAINNNPGDPKSYGMLYQWGRKDPFPNAATLTGNTQTLSAPVYDSMGNLVTFSHSDWYSLDYNTLEYAIANPTVCLSNYSQYSYSRDWLESDLSDDSLWGNPLGDYFDYETSSYINQGTKTCYDPSPAGWRVPPCDVFSNFTSSGGYTWLPEDFNVRDLNEDEVIDINDYNYGWQFAVNNDSYLYFPAASRFDGSYAMLMGSMCGLWGNYWTNAPYSNIEGGAFCGLSFQVKDQYGNDMLTMSPAAGASRADAYSIRCIRDTK